MAKAILVENEKVISYPKRDFYFSPSICYPEYPWGDKYIAKEINEVYELVRNSLYQAGYDSKNFGTKDWNPLGEFIQSGQTVLLKPNWVENKNSNKNVKDNLSCLVTNPSVVRVILDYVCIALKGTGTIIVADAPMQQCDLQNLFEIVGYDCLFDFYAKEVNQKIIVQDLRKYSITAISRGVFTAPKAIENSPGSITISLDANSLHAEHDNINPKYKVSEYKQQDTAAYHHGNSHSYEISKYPIMADVIINIPKPKTHRLAGMTAAIKNMVGITYEKACLPHRKAGDKESGGDTYQKKSFWKEQMQLFDEKKTTASTSGRYKSAWMYDFIMKGCYLMGWLFTGDKYRIGSWYGNDTIWRTSIDLNYILLYADKKGELQNNIQRKVLTIADMIVAGQGAGPVGPHPKSLGMIMLAENSLLFDRIMCEIMGFDSNKIAMFNNSLTYHCFGYKSEEELENEDVLYNHEKIKVKDIVAKKKWKFDAHPCWKGHIEK